MEEKEPKKISVGMAIAIFIIIVLLLVILGMSLYNNNKLFNTANEVANEPNKISTNEEKQNVVNETVKNEQNQNVVKKINKVNEEKDLVYTSLNKVTSEASYSIPYINIKSDEIDKINQEIQKKYKEYTNKETLGGIKYTSYLNDNVLSLVITELTPSDSKYFNIYNVDVYEGKKLNNSTLIASKNITESDFLTKLKTAHKKGFEKVWGTKEECLNRFSGILEGEEGAKLYDELLNKTISDKNYSIKNSQMFLGNNGKINVVANIYAFAGPESLNHIIEVDI